MDYELPKNFDLIVVGTGVIESIVSAAASRIGKTVLHIDNNDYYGGLWASFNLEAFFKLLHVNQIIKQPAGEIPVDVISLGNNLIQIKDVDIKWHIPERQAENEEIKWTQESLLKESRRFNLDLVPKLHFARGDFVELLISSNIARYSEFRSVSRVLTWLNGNLEIVPCSRSDVFANNKVTVIEKRMLMKLFTSLDGEDITEGYENKTFKAFLKDKKLTPNLIHYVLYAIAMCTDETSCLEGISNVRRFLNSLGRFGKTPFLYSSYGSGEITQAFCRLSAVFGGIYALNQSLNGLIVSDGCCKGVICGKQRIMSTHIVMGADKAPEIFVKLPEHYISRAIFITDRSILEDEKEHLTLLLYPPENGKNSVVIIEAGTLTGICPRDLYVVHLIAKQVVSPMEDFKDCTNLFGDDNIKPKILWSAYFSIPEINSLDLKTDYTNLFLCPGPDLDLDYDFTVKKAKEMFSSIYPDLEFLPRAPDPEEIIIEGEVDSEETNDNEVNNENTTENIEKSIEEMEIK